MRPNWFRKFVDELGDARLHGALAAALLLVGVLALLR
jgi:hypothetical protein